MVVLINGDFIAFRVKIGIFDVTIDVIYYHNIKLIEIKIQFLKSSENSKRYATICCVLNMYYGRKTTKCPNFMVKMT